MESTTMKILDENKNLIECEILFTFDCAALGKSYLAYKCNKEGKEKEILVANYDPNSELNKLEPVTDQKELMMVYDVLGEIMEDYEDSQHE